MRRSTARLAVLVALLATASARAADDAAPTLRGAWSAKNAAGAIFRGAWTAGVVVASPNVALGTWTLVDDHGVVRLAGTWSARKAPRGWRGAWSARLAVTNQLFSGTWEADDSTLKGGKTFRDLLARAAAKQVAGVWHMGRAHGTWWLTAPP